jgi:hypothetical protein
MASGGFESVAVEEGEGESEESEESLETNS